MSTYLPPVLFQQYCAPTLWQLSTTSAPRDFPIGSGTADSSNAEASVLSGTTPGLFPTPWLSLSTACYSCRQRPNSPPSHSYSRRRSVEAKLSDIHRSHTQETVQLPEQAQQSSGLQRQPPLMREQFPLSDPEWEQQALQQLVDY